MKRLYICEKSERALAIGNAIFGIMPGSLIVLGIVTGAVAAFWAALVLTLFFVIRGSFFYLIAYGDAQRGWKHYVEVDYPSDTRKLMMHHFFTFVSDEAVGVPFFGYWLAQKNHSTLLHVLHENFYKKRIIQPL